MDKLTAKVFLRGVIRVETGLHVGGSKSSLDIGGIDLNVVKTARGVPYVPGSSLKGKLRSLLAREKGSRCVENDGAAIEALFGCAGRDKAKTGAGRVIVRDAFLDEKLFGALKETLSGLDFEYTEVKWENTINRVTGTAEHPRQLERVPVGCLFHFELVYNAADDGKEEEHLAMLTKALRLLEDDYLGGQGSRGYGKVKFGRLQGDDFKPGEIERVRVTVGDYASVDGKGETGVVQLRAGA
jgi:CRISPR-associated protein Csm3